MQKLLEIKNVCKSFSSVEVLKDLNITIGKKEVHALLGANGAGKSTLIKIIGAIINKTSGSIIFNDREINFSSPIEAQKNGISIIHQELSIIPTLTVLENFFLGREIIKNGFISKKSMIEVYEKTCDEMGFNIGWNIRAKDLTVAKHQMIEIMKAVSFESDLIIMDEPTTSLTDIEKENLFNIISDLKERGKTIIYVSHMLDEIFKISDKATIMFDGQNAGTFNIEDLTKNKIAELMIGKSIVQIQSREKNISYDSKPVLRVENLTVEKKVNNINFSLYKGEVLGIAGLVGAGRTELVQAIFGMYKNKSGKIFLNEKHVSIKSPKNAIDIGIGLIAEDRKRQGLCLKHEVYKNATILSLAALKKYYLINKKLEFEYTKNAIDEFKIKVASLYQKVQNLSGGNQQKVVLSKWLGKKLSVIILDEPTKGIDVNAKEDIFQAVDNFTSNGTSVIFISSDIEEVIRVSDRIMVMQNGNLVKIRNNDGLSVLDLMQDILVDNI